MIVEDISSLSTLSLWSRWLYLITLVLKTPQRNDEQEIPRLSQTNLNVMDPNFDYLIETSV